MKPFPPLAALIGLIAAAAGPASAAVYSVGPDTGCTHAVLQAAINTARTAPGGPHRIKLLTGELSLTTAVAIFDPEGDLTIEGGYASCGDATPGDDARTVIRQTGANSGVLHISNDSANDRRYITLRRMMLTGGNLLTGLGGGAVVTERASLILDQQSRIEGNTAAHGGGVGLVGFDPLSSAEVLVTNGSSINGNEATDLLGAGGGIYVRGFGAARLINGEVSNNRARWAGGGVALDGFGGSGASLHINPPAAPDADSPIILTGNIAGQATFATDEGFGGAIYSRNGRIDITAPNNVNQFTTLLLENEANYGGAIYVETLGAPELITYVDLRNTFVAGNIARGRGGAFYSRNQVQWRISHSHSIAGDCLLAGLPLPCSVVANNEARNETTPGTPGGGVGYIWNSVGTPGGIFRFERTLFLNNDDVNGGVAIATALVDSVLQFDRSVFVGNRAGSSNGVLIANAAGMDTRFVFNTVLANDVDKMFSMNGGTLLTQGSILWDPGTPIWTAVNGASMLHNACLIAHTAIDLPNGVTVVEPDLDTRFAPRGGSPAIDHCDELGLVPAIDLYRQESNYDAPGVPLIYGDHDLGAVENRDIVFFGGFGQRFDN